MKREKFRIHEITPSTFSLLRINSLDKTYLFEIHFYPTTRLRKLKISEALRFLNFSFTPRNILH